MIEILNSSQNTMLNLKATMARYIHINMEIKVDGKIIRWWVRRSHNKSMIGIERDQR